MGTCALHKVGSAIKNQHYHGEGVNHQQVGFDQFNYDMRLSRDKGLNQP